MAPTPIRKRPSRKRLRSHVPIDVQKVIMMPDPSFFMGRSVQKFFRQSHCPFSGKVKKYSVDNDCYFIVYEDNDEEELTIDELMELIIPTEHTESFAIVPRVNPLLSSKPSRTTTTPTLRSIYGFENTKIKNSRLDFYLFVIERQRIWERRDRGDPWPWTANPVLQNHLFCNVYRELDRGSQFLQRHLRREQITDPVQVLWTSYSYRLVNRRESFEALGFPQRENLAAYFRKVSRYKKSNAFFTGAHQTTNLRQLQVSLESMAVGVDDDDNNNSKRKDRLAAIFRKMNSATTIEDTLRSIQQLPCVGNFLAWQIFCDLVEANVFEFAFDSCLLGPGAIQGLKFLFGRSDPRTPLEQASSLVAQADSFYRDTVGEEFPYWNKQPLTLKEIEHALCEYAKFCRSHKTGKGLRSYRPSATTTTMGYRCSKCYDPVVMRGICQACRDYATLVALTNE